MKSEAQSQDITEQIKQIPVKLNDNWIFFGTGKKVNVVSPMSLWRPLTFIDRDGPQSEISVRF